MESLNELNEKGRTKLALQREELENFDLYVKYIRDPKYKKKLETERQHLARWYIYLLPLYFVRF